MFYTRYTLISAIMRADSEMTFLDFLAVNPVFDLLRVRNAFPDSSSQAALKRVRRAMDSGRVKRLQKDLFAAVPAGTALETYNPDRFLVMLTLRPDAIFCGHSALELLGASHSTTNLCLAYTSGRRANLDLGGVSLTAFANPAPLEKHGNSKLGVESGDRLGKTIHLTGRERTLVDGFWMPGRVGGLEELVQSASGFPVLNFELLQKVLEAYASSKLYACIGWFLDRNREQFYVGEEILDLLRARRPASPKYMARHSGEATFDSQWNLMVPNVLLRGGEDVEA